MDERFKKLLMGVKMKIENYKRSLEEEVNIK